MTVEKKPIEVSHETMEAMRREAGFRPTKILRRPAPAPAPVKVTTPMPAWGKKLQASMKPKAATKKPSTDESATPLRPLPPRGMPWMKKYRKQNGMLKKQ